MANNIATQDLLATELDKELVSKIMTSDMETNGANISYNGGSTFSYMKLSFPEDPIKDYDRDAGFGNATAITVEKEVKKFKWDKSIFLRLDVESVNENGFVATAKATLDEVLRTKMAPSVDKARFNEIYTLTTKNGSGAHVRKYTIAANGALNELRAAINDVEDGTGLTEADLDIYLRRDFYNALVGDKDVTKIVNLAGSPVQLNGSIKSVDGIAVKVVDTAIMGKAEYLVMHKTAPIAVVRHNVTKIIEPEVNQTADAYDIKARLHHTLEIKDNEMKGIAIGIPAA